MIFSIFMLATRPHSDPLTMRLELLNALLEDLLVILIACVGVFGSNIPIATVIATAGGIVLASLLIWLQVPENLSLGLDRPPKLNLLRS